MKKILVLILLTLCVGCSTQNSKSPTVTPSETAQTGSTGNKPCDVSDPCGEADMSEYETLVDSQHVFKRLEYKDLNELITSEGTGIIYIGRPTCPWCAEAVPVLNEIAKEHNQTIYYVFTRSEYSESEEGIAAKAELIDFLQDYLDENDEGEKTLYIPDILFLKKGKVMANHIGTVGDYDAHERSMTEEELAEFKQILENNFIEFEQE